MIPDSLRRSGHDPSRLFHRSVNKRNIPDYYDVIKEPMALSILKQKINKREYRQFSEFVRDCALVRRPRYCCLSKTVTDALLAFTRSHTMRKHITDQNRKPTRMRS